MRLSSLLLSSLVSFSSFPLGVFGHVAMDWPAPRGSPAAASFNHYQVNYDIKSPGQGCSPNGSPPPGNLIASGSTITVRMRKDGASHNGGVCQWSLNGQVIQTDNDCPNTGNGSPKDWTVKIPANVQTGQGIFTWTWNAKATGEVYKNCADVIVTSGGGGGNGGGEGPVPVPDPVPQPAPVPNPQPSPQPPAPMPPLPPAPGCSCNVTPKPSSNSNGQACPGSLCRSKWGFCGSGPAYCAAENRVASVAEVNDTEMNDAEAEEEQEEEEEVHVEGDEEVEEEERRSFSSHYSDDWLLEQSEQLLASKSEADRELAQIWEELSRRDAFDGKRQAEAESEKKREEESRRRKAHRAHSKRPHRSSRHQF
jgi:hypothetical protein